MRVITVVFFLRPSAVRLWRARYVYLTGHLLSWSSVAGGIALVLNGVDIARAAGPVRPPDPRAGVSGVPSPMTRARRCQVTGRRTRRRRSLYRADRYDLRLRLEGA